MLLEGIERVGVLFQDGETLNGSPRAICTSTATRGPSTHETRSPACNSKNVRVTSLEMHQTRQNYGDCALTTHPLLREVS